MDHLLPLQYLLFLRQTQKKYANSIPSGECELSSGIGLEGALRFLEPRKIT